MNINGNRMIKQVEELKIQKYLYICLEIINLAIPNNSLYSCKKCQNGRTLVKIKSKGKEYCYLRISSFNYCIEGEIEEKGKHIC